jgi:hypothetical protein
VSRRRIAAAGQDDDAHGLQRTSAVSPVIALIKRGREEGAFDPELSVSWIEHALYALVRQGCEDANNGEMLRHTVAQTVIRTFEQGVSARAPRTVFS